MCLSGPLRGARRARLEDCAGVVSQQCYREERRGQGFSDECLLNANACVKCREVSIKPVPALSAASAWSVFVLLWLFYLLTVEL